MTISRQEHNKNEARHCLDQRMVWCSGYKCRFLTYEIGSTWNLSGLNLWQNHVVTILYKHGTCQINNRAMVLLPISLREKMFSEKQPSQSSKEIPLWSCVQKSIFHSTFGSSKSRCSTGNSNLLNAAWQVGTDRILHKASIHEDTHAHSHGGSLYSDQCPTLFRYIQAAGVRQCEQAWGFFA